MIACNSDKKISIEDPEFDNYFYKNKNIPIVKGKILNLTKDEIKNIQLKYTIVRPFEIDRFQITKLSTLKQDGTFELELDYPFPYQEIWLEIGELYYAGIYAKSDLFIELDADLLREKKGYMNGPGIKYLGTDGKVNTLLNNHFLYKQTQQLNTGRAIYDLSSDQNIAYDTFLNKYDSLYAVLHHIDDEFIEKNPSPYSYLIKNERMSEYYGNLCVVHWESSKYGKIKMNNKLHKEIITHKTYLTSNRSSTYYYYLFEYLRSQVWSYNKSWTGFIGLIDEATNFINYNKLSDYEKNRMDQLLKFREQMDKQQPYDTIKFAELYTSFSLLAQDSIKRHITSKIVDYLDSIFISSKADLLKLQISSRNANEKAMIHKAVLQTIRTKWCDQIIREENQKNDERLSLLARMSKEENFKLNKNLQESIEELPSGAQLYKIHGMSAEDVLAGLKSKFKGKALVLDFWATWCSPCIQEMPYSKKLHQELKDHPIEFIYLCTSDGSDLAEWKTKVSKLELSGTHLFVESGIERKLMTLFSVSGFPSLAFIDTQGNYKPGAITRMSNLSKETLTKLIDEK